MIATSTLTYDDRLRALRERKLAQTAEKIAAYGSMDEDDYEGGGACALREFRKRGFFQQNQSYGFDPFGGQRPIGLG